MNSQSCKKKNPAAVPTEDELDNLGPGCYVQVALEKDCCYWAEITSYENSLFTATVHSELGEAGKGCSKNRPTTINFTKEQVINLGCDNYCWC